MNPALQFITDATGEKTAVVLPIPLYEQMLRDLHAAGNAGGPVARAANLEATGLDEAYRQMAADEGREAEALEWSENLIGDVAHEPR